MRLATAQHDYQRNTVKLVFTRLVQLVSVTSVTSVTRLLDYFFNIWPFNNNENFANLVTLIATHTRLACSLDFILPFLKALYQFVKMFNFRRINIVYSNLLLKTICKLTFIRLTCTRSRPEGTLEICHLLL